MTLKKYILKIYFIMYLFSHTNLVLYIDISVFINLVKFKII
jgi:hypothetical protein